MRSIFSIMIMMMVVVVMTMMMMHGIRKYKSHHYFTYNFEIKTLSFHLPARQLMCNICFSCCSVTSKHDGTRKQAVE